MKSKVKLMLHGLAFLGLIFLFIFLIYQGNIEIVKDMLGIKSYGTEIGKSIASIRG